jgi:hypothetical protein
VHLLLLVEILEAKNGNRCHQAKSNWISNGILVFVAIVGKEDGNATFMAFAKRNNTKKKIIGKVYVGAETVRH